MTYRSIDRLFTTAVFVAIRKKMHQYTFMRKKFFKPIGIGSATALIAITSFLSYAMGGEQLAIGGGSISWLMYPLA